MRSTYFTPDELQAISANESAGRLVSTLTPIRPIAFRGRGRLHARRRNNRDQQRDQQGGATHIALRNGVW